MPLSTQEQRKILATELTSDPESVGYSAMTDEEVLNALTTVNRTIDVDIIETWKLYAALQADGSEFASFVGSGAWDEFKAILSLGSISVRDTGIRQRIGSMFPDNIYPNIRASLITLQGKPATRLQELGIPIPTLHQISRVNRVRL